MKKVRLEDIARECGVTKGLVSRALAGEYNVSDKTRNLIVQKAVELGYDFSRLRSKSKTRKTVTLVAARSILLKEDFWQPILEHLSAVLNRSSIDLDYFVFNSDGVDDDALAKLRESPCIAFIVLHVNPDEIYETLVETGKPIIEVDPKIVHADGSTQVKLSNYNSIYFAVAHLYKYGHRAILFYGSDMHSTSFRERHEGFKAAVEDTRAQGLVGYEAMFDNSDLQYSDNDLLRATLEEHPDITALVCANDLCALNAYKVIARMGKRIPEDYSVIGFDNIRTDIRVIPTLSTFNVPREQIGEEIGRYVIGLTTGDRPQYSVFVVRCSYIERDSVRKMERSDPHEQNH